MAGRDEARFQLFLALEDEAVDALSVDPTAEVPHAGALPTKESGWHYFDLLGEAGSLPRQKWGVVVPAGDPGKAYLDAVAPLVHAREEEQGMAVTPFTAPPTMSPDEAIAWVRSTLGSIPEARRPRYLLLLGDLHEIPLELQAALAVSYFPGRLAFDGVDGYRAYAEKVVRVEGAEPQASAQVAAYTAHLASPSLNLAIKDGYTKLVEPLRQLSQAQFDDEALPARFVAANAPGNSSRAGFLEFARGAAPATVLFSMSHGLGQRASVYEIRRKRQGAMVFDDGWVTADDVREGPFLPGGVWFLFACYGAGTPKASAYQHWLRTVSPGLARTVTGCLPAENEAPFVAALPRAALANPEGPLAVIGHMDLAWSFAYDARSVDAGDPLERFACLAKLADRKAWSRAGAVYADLVKDLDKLNKGIADAYDRDEAAVAQGKQAASDPKARAMSWLLRQDLGAYVLLGDPAAYLPIPRRVPKDRAVPAAKAAPAAAPAADDGERVADAVLKLLRGEGSAGDLAGAIGISADDLAACRDAFVEAGRKAVVERRRGRI